MFVNEDETLYTVQSIRKVPRVGGNAVTPLKRLCCYLETTQAPILHVITKNTKHGAVDIISFDRPRACVKIQYFSSMYREDLQHSRVDRLSVIGYYHHQEKRWVLFNGEQPEPWMIDFISTT